MRLFTALMKTKMPNGDIFRGKDRLVTKVEPKHLGVLRQEFEIEDQNMFLLRHPFLTFEQSFGHSQALGLPEQRFTKLRSKAKEFKDNVSMESRLAHLRFGEAWE